MNQIILDKLKAFAPESIRSTSEFRGDLTVTVAKDAILRIGGFLKSDPALAFDQLIDVVGIDMYRSEERFEVLYNLYSLTNKAYVRLKVAVEEADPFVPSMVSVWLGANWHERETYDMFGIKFTGHPDLRRLFMPEEFEYFPLRKDFPTMGIPDSLPLPRR
jgi:NADH-quinone oxidoreductase subunit C